MRLKIESANPIYLEVDIDNLYELVKPYLPRIDMVLNKLMGPVIE